MNRPTRPSRGSILVALSLAAASCGAGERGGTTAPTGSVVTTTSCGASASPSAVRAIDPSGAGSTVALGALGGKTLAFIADEDDAAIHVVDVDSGALLSTTLLEGQPSQLVLLGDGRLAVAVRNRSQLHVFDNADPRRPLVRGCAVTTAAEPVALAVTPDAKTLLVSSDWGQSLGAYDVSTFERRFAVALPRSPRAVVVSDDGKRAFVSHAAGSRMSTVDLHKHTVDAISLTSRSDRQEQSLRRTLESRGITGAALASEIERTRESMRSQERSSCQGFALTKTRAPEGRVLAPHVLVDPGEVLERSPGYGEEQQVTEIPSVAVIDTGTASPLGESLDQGNPWQTRGRRGELLEECILPRSATIDHGSETLLVGCFGIDSVVAYDASSARPGDAEIHRWRVAAGPTGLAVDAAHKRAIVWSQFDRTLSTLDLADLDPERLTTEPDKIAQIELEPTPGRALTIAERLGRRLFHATQDSRIAADGRACASCHPGGRDDGLVWSTPNGPRRTIPLAGRIDGTAPYGWGGDAKNLEGHLTETFARLGGVGGLRSVELDALMEYVQSMQPPPAVDIANAAALRGARIFASTQAGCAKCHTGDELTDNTKHDVGSRADSDREGAFETPSLRFVAARGPYFHDGRYATLRELLQKSDGKMGNVGHLSAADLEALEAYVLSL